MELALLGAAWLLGIYGIVLARTLDPRKVLASTAVAIILVVYTVNLFPQSRPDEKLPVVVKEGKL
jgi:hypothetical protein